MKLTKKGYKVLVSDPNFNAIEDRMVCRLHGLTKRRYIEIAQSQARSASRKEPMEQEAQKIRDHVAFTYAIQTSGLRIMRREKSQNISD